MTAIPPARAVTVSGHQGQHDGLGGQVWLHNDTVEYAFSEGSTGHENAEMGGTLNVSFTWKHTCDSISLEVSVNGKWSTTVRRQLPVNLTDHNGNVSVSGLPDGVGPQISPVCPALFTSPPVCTPQVCAFEGGLLSNRTELFGKIGVLVNGSDSIRAFRVPPRSGWQLDLVDPGVESPAVPGSSSTGTPTVHIRFVALAPDTAIVEVTIQATSVVVVITAGDVENRTYTGASGSVSLVPIGSTWQVVVTGADGVLAPFPAFAHLAPLPWLTGDLNISFSHMPTTSLGVRVTALCLA
jgi:hypothetical protein